MSSDNKPKVPPSFRGVYRGGVVRMLTSTPWDDGVQVEVQLSDRPANGRNADIGLVIIAGFGLAGRWVAQIFDRHHIDYVVVEQNPDTVKRQKLLGRKIILGDIADPATLEAASIDQADILALTIPDERAVLRATELARRMQPGIYIVARTNYTSSGMEAAQLGADAVVKAEQAVANRFYELLLHRLQQTPARS